MSNPLRRPTPEDGPEDPNHPESDNPGGAVGGARPRDENSLSFRHFLQSHSDVVPQPPPTRSRSSTRPGGVDLVDVTMALPDFVQDHLVMESIAEPSQDMSPSRPHPLDLNVLNDILPEFNPTQRNPQRINSKSTRRSVHEPPTSDNDSPVSHSTALPDFLSDGPMQLNNDPSILNSPSPSLTGRGSRGGRQPLENLLIEEPVRGPSFESKESLRLEIERLRMELSDKNRRVSQLEADLARQRNVTSALESSLRSTERHLSDAVKRATESEKRLMSIQNGHGGDQRSSLQNGIESQLNNATTIFNLASTSETLLSQLLGNMERLKQLSATETGSTATGEHKQQKDTSTKSKSVR